MASTILNYVNYDKLSQNTEFLTTEKWDIQVVKWPEAVYYPGDEFFKMRVKEIQGLGQQLYQAPPLETQWRGLTLPPQAGQMKVINNQISISLYDQEDQSLMLVISDWKSKISEMKTQQSFRSSQLRGEFIFRVLNSQDEVVRSYRMRNAILADSMYEDPMLGDKTLRGEEIQLVLYGFVEMPELNTLA